MSWNCSNSCHIITTNIAQQIIAANSPSTLEFVEFTDLDGSHFHVTVSDAPCLKIVLDLNDGGGLVLQQIGILLNNLAYVRSDTYDSDALQHLRCVALCPSPFNVQLSPTVGLIACAGCTDACPKPIDNSARFLMLIAFFLGLLTLLYFLSLLCYFWRQWTCNPCSVGCTSCNTINTKLPSVLPVFEPSVLNGLSSDALLTLKDLLNTSDSQPLKIKK